MHATSLPDPVTASHPTDTTEQRYCYHCRSYHPAAQMRRIATRGGGYRWRCKQSLEAARQDRAGRDAWGRQTSATNRAENQRRAERLNLLLRLQPGSRA